MAKHKPPRDRPHRGVRQKGPSSLRFIRPSDRRSEQDWIDSQPPELRRLLRQGGGPGQNGRKAPRRRR